MSSSQSYVLHWNKWGTTYFFLQHKQIKMCTKFKPFVLLHANCWVTVRLDPKRQFIRYKIKQKRQAGRGGTTGGKRVGSRWQGVGWSSWKNPPRRRRGTNTGSTSEAEKSSTKLHRAPPWQRGGLRTRLMQTGRWREWRQASLVCSLSAASHAPLPHMCTAGGGTTFPQCSF